MPSNSKKYRKQMNFGFWHVSIPKVAELQILNCLLEIIDSKLEILLAKFCPKAIF